MTTRNNRRTTAIIGTAVTAVVVGALAPVPDAAAVPGVTVAEGEAVITLGTRDGRTAWPERIALGGGRLTVTGWADPERLRGLYEYDLPAFGGVEPGPRRLAKANFWVRWPCGGQTDELCDHFDSRLWALGDGRVGYHAPLGHQEASGGQVPPSEASLAWWEAPDVVAGAAGPYIVVNNTRQGKQLIGSFDRSDAGPPDDRQGLVHSRDITASAVWGDALWKPGSRTGTVNAYNLRTEAVTRDIDLGSGCRPDELQAVGRWLYWRCTAAARAGVWDHAEAGGIPVPATAPAQLGDGFLVWKLPDRSELRLLDFHRGAGGATAQRRIADRPLIGEWTVDKYGGHVAYVDEEHRIRIVPVDVPRSPVTALDARTDATVHLRSGSVPPPRWTGHWRLSRPAASWRLTFSDAYGRTVRVVSGTERDGAAIRAGWDGRTADGRPVAGGPYGWTLSADPGDGTGPRVVSRGTMRVLGGRSAYRDANGDGYGEYYAMTTGGKLSAHRVGPVTGSWASGAWNPATRFVPFGDIDGDGCDDMLLRTVDGDLWRTGGRCEGYYFPSNSSFPHVRIGAGWNGFDAFAAPGDLTGDGRPDLLARQTTTGYLFLYRSNATGGLDPAVRVGTGWKGYRLIGAGDLDGDGHGDLLARDPAGELWRYGGTGRGTFKPRALVFRDWGAGRTDIIGVGDISGDGLPDLLSRDANGKLLRNKGNGKGSFGATATISTGWQYYRALY
ncbi:FG-GAP-like repeat-containing protein [Streptomyces coeruleoprunus]|uniref:FG-GAP-like repeat-containing protein n=1 Tax=Streptomyces coeruleoprunus TaxID=285563 RepID=A0ABV9XBR4_9ACTN